MSLQKSLLTAFSSLKAYGRLMHELSSRTLWSFTIALAASVFALSLVAIKYLPDLAESQKRGKQEAISSLENESHALEGLEARDVLTERFLSAEINAIREEISSLSKEL
jgi:hypothetical protein